MTIKPRRPICREEAIRAYRQFMEALGYDLESEPGFSSVASGKDTAVRAVDAFIEFLTRGQEHFQFTTFPADGTKGMVVITGIEFFSLCSHHMLLYNGVAHVGYLPDKRVCGLSKLVRAVDHYAFRPSIQEDLTSKIATFIEEQLEPKGCGVVIEATHGCMACRGVRRPHHRTVTADVRGVFEETAVRNEFHTLIQQSKLGT